MPRIIDVIESEVTRGAGTDDNLLRRVLQYHLPNGDFVAENDPVNQAHEEIKRLSEQASTYRHCFLKVIEYVESDPELTHKMILAALRLSLRMADENAAGKK